MLLTKYWITIQNYPIIKDVTATNAAIPIQSVQVLHLHDFMQNGMIQHCTLDAATFRAGETSPMDWLIQCIHGQCADYGLQLMK